MYFFKYSFTLAKVYILDHLYQRGLLRSTDGNRAFPLLILITLKHAAVLNYSILNRALSGEWIRRSISRDVAISPCTQKHRTFREAVLNRVPLTYEFSALSTAPLLSCQLVGSKNSRALCFMSTFGAHFDKNCPFRNIVVKHDGLELRNYQYF